jgi:putative hydrolase of the HAD superfamily
MNNKYQHIFFDLDRTLWHFDENSKKVLNDIYIQFKLEDSVKKSDDFIIKYQEINEALWSDYRDEKVTKEELRTARFFNTLKFFNVNDIHLANDIGDYYIQESPKQTILFPDTIEVLGYLSKKYKLYIITNGFEEVQFIKLKESKIHHFFEEVILSERVGVRKPHPLIFKRALKASGATSNNSIMIGDDWYADIYGAQRVKMDHIYFNPNRTEHNNEVTTEINALNELYNIL